MDHRFKMESIKNSFGQRSWRGVLNTSSLKQNSLKKKSNSDFHQKWKQPKCPSMDECINNVIYKSSKYYSVLERNFRHTL